MKWQYIYGINTVFGAIKARPQSVGRLFISGKSGRVKQLMQQAQFAKIDVVFCSKSDIESMAGEENHQGVVLEVIPQAILDEKWLYQQAEEPVYILILDGITDPHNFGAILRSADAVGVEAVVIARHNSCPINDTVAKVACGAVETVPVVMVTNINRTLDKIKQLGVWVIGTSDSAELKYTDIDYRGSIAVVMGSEDKGLRRQVTEKCDYLARIPMLGQVNSLNVASATSVVLFEAIRQRL